MKLTNRNTSFTFQMIFVLGIALTMSCKKNIQEDSISGEASNKNNKSVTIRFLGHWHNERLREELVRNVTREYEFTHQEVHIELKFPNDVYNHCEDPLSNQKFVWIILKQNPEWDIIRFNNEYQGIGDITNDPLWDKKSLSDFSEIEEFRKNTIPELLTDSVKKLWHGIIPGPFIEGVNWALFCNNAAGKKCV